MANEPRIRPRFSVSESEQQLCIRIPTGQHWLIIRILVILIVLALCMLGMGIYYLIEDLFFPPGSVPAGAFANIYLGWCVIPASFFLALPVFALAFCYGFQEK